MNYTIWVAVDACELSSEMISNAHSMTDLKAQYILSDTCTEKKLSGCCYRTRYRNDIN